MMVVVLLVVALLVLGTILMAVEVLIIPGFGVVGVLGVGAMASACILAYLQLGSEAAALSVLAGVVISGLLFWRLPKTRTAKSMVLSAAHKGHAADPSLAALQDARGVAISDLRPAGSASIDGRVVDVITDGDYVERGSAICVVAVKGPRVIVSLATDSDNNEVTTGATTPVSNNEKRGT